MAFSIRSCIWHGIVFICISFTATVVIYQAAIRSVAVNSNTLDVVYGGYSLSNSSALLHIRGRVVELLKENIVDQAPSENSAVNQVFPKEAPMDRTVVNTKNTMKAENKVSKDDLLALKKRIGDFLDWVSQQSGLGVKNVLNWSRLANNEIHLMKILFQFLTIIESKKSQITSNFESLARDGYQCSALEQTQQKEISKTIHMDICSEIEWYKVIHLCWPSAKSFLDVGANKGYLGSLFVALWGLNSFGVTPARIFEISTKLKSWETSRNPAGYCRDGYNHGIPLFCIGNRDPTSGECRNTISNQVKVYSIDGSSYLTETLNSIITTQFSNNEVRSGNVWKYFNFAMSDRSGSIFFTKQSKTSNPGFEGGSIKTNGGANTEEVNMTSVDKFVKSQNIEDLDVLKVDTEGNDNKVIVGASYAIRKNVKLFTFEGGKGVVLSKEMIAQFDELGFSCYSTSRAGLFKWNGGCMPEEFMGPFSAKDKGNIFCASRLRIPLVTLALDALSFPLLIKATGITSHNFNASSVDSATLSASFLNIKSFCQPWPSCVNK